MSVTEAAGDPVSLSFVYSADSLKKTLHVGQGFSREFHVKMKQEGKSALLYIGGIKFVLSPNGNSDKLGG